MSEGVHSTTFHPELRNERFTLISFMGFPAILSALQPFQICIFIRKYSKLTFWNDPQLMGKKVYGNFACITRQYKCKSRISKMSMRCQTWGGGNSTTFDPELRNERSTLIYFYWVSCNQPFQICIFNRKYSKLTFSCGSQLMGKRFMAMCMHHQMVHAKVEFPRFLPDVIWGAHSHSTIFDSELRNAISNMTLFQLCYIFLMYIPDLYSLLS